jgi:hypothetical protein
MRKAFGFDGNTKECLGHFPRRPLVHLTHLFNHYLRLYNFPLPWKEARVISLQKAGTDSKFPKNLRPISLLSTTGKLFGKIILQMIQRHIEGTDLLNACQFGFRARHSSTLQCMRLTDIVTLTFNNDTPTVAIFLDTENKFVTT